MDQFADAPYVAIRTYRPSGSTVATPVWSTVVDGKLYFGTPEHTHKVTRIRSDARVQVAVCDSRGNTAGPGLTAMRAF